MDPLSTFTPGRSGWGDIINQNWIDLDERMSALQTIDAISVENDSYFAGQLGLGTLAPTERLHVVGNAIITGSTLQGGNVNVSKVAPEHRLTTTGDSKYTRLTRVETSAVAQRKSYVDKPVSMGFNINFDGEADDDGIQFGNILQYEYDIPFSIGFIMEADNVTGRQSLVNKIAPSGTFPGWSVALSQNGDGTITFEIVDRVNTEHLWVHTTAAVVSNGVPVRILCTYSGINDVSGMHIYVDGNDEALTTVKNLPINSTIANVNPLAFGYFPGVSTLHYDGALDEINIWGEERSQSEATAGYNGGNYLFLEPGGNADGIWHCDTGIGTTLIDSSGNGYDSVAWVNTPTWSSPGFVATPGADVEVKIWKIEDGASAGEAGILTIGDNETRSQRNGKTHHVQIAGVDVATIDESGVWHFGVGTDQTTIDSNGNVIFIGAGGLPFAGISAEDVMSTVTITGTGVANKVQVTAFDTNDPSNNATPDHANDHITIVKSGMYYCSVSISVESTVPGAAALIDAEVWVNNGATDKHNCHAHRNLSGGGSDFGAMTLSGIIDLAEDDTVEVWMWNETNTANIIIDNITLSLIQIGGT